MLEFFKIFPFFASSYFYILLITTGYLKSSNKRLFVDLGFLVPFSTIINCTLKSIFNIPRPDLATHLIPVSDMLGFPSGDAQIATIFWGIIAINYKSKNLRIISIVMISIISISRVYLGVHTILNVIAGICFGLCIIAIWKNPQVIKVMDNWMNGNTKRLWLLIIFSYFIFITTSRYEHTPSIVIMSLGALIGLAIFLSYGKITHKISNWTSILLSVIVVVAAAKLLPTIYYNIFTTWISTIAKYVMIIYLVYMVTPKVNIGK